jgi:hypothetical protein
MDKLFNDFGYSREKFKYLLSNNNRFYETSFWKGSDSEERFKKNYKEKEYWIDKKIEYRYNNYGFRTDTDFNSNIKGVVTLGCSFTEGIGLPLELTWGAKLAKHLNLPHINLGSSGTGLTTSFRLLLGIIGRVQFDSVFLLTPPPFRFETYVGDNELLKQFMEERSKRKDIFSTLHRGNVQEWMSHDFTEGEDVLRSYLLGSDVNAEMQQMLTLCAIEGLCNQAGVGFYYQTYENMTTASFINLSEQIPDEECPDIPARDFHWGAKRQHLVYKRFIDKINGVN